ncbi:MAG TPA: hypothetical protein VFJ85_01010 [Acidimicrobiales bacterium]|nr:hypothetical protein [Acidimicrobiales bacterium]
MAAGVVHRLHPIDVDEADDQAGVRAPAPVDLVLQPGEAVAPAQDPGELVGAGRGTIEPGLMARQRGLLPIGERLLPQKGGLVDQQRRRIPVVGRRLSVGRCRIPVNCRRLSVGCYGCQGVPGLGPAAAPSSHRCHLVFSCRVLPLGRRRREPTAVG